MTDVQTQITTVDKQITNLMARREGLVLKLTNDSPAPTLRALRALFDDDIYSRGHERRAYNQRIVYSLLARQLTNKSLAQIGKVIARDTSTISTYLNKATAVHRKQAREMAQALVSKE